MTSKHFFKCLLSFVIKKHKCRDMFFYIYFNQSSQVRIFKSISVDIAIWDPLIIHHSSNRLNYRGTERAWNGRSTPRRGEGGWNGSPLTWVGSGGRPERGLQGREVRTRRRLTRGEDSRWEGARREKSQGAGLAEGATQGVTPEEGCCRWERLPWREPTVGDSCH